MAFLSTLEKKNGEPIDPSTALQGKIVALYFSSSWCPACKTFTPLLSVLYDDAKEEGEHDFEVVYVSSDTSAESCDTYMQQKHADWLRVPYNSRQSYKERYGVFAGKEQSDFPTTSRRSGIPTLVIVGPDGQEHAMLDCDSPTVLKEIQQQGCKYLERWAKFKW